MKKYLILSIFGLLCFVPTKAQNYLFKYSADSLVLEKNIQELANKLLKIEFNELNTEEIDDLFRIEIAAKDYEGALNSIDNIRKFYKDDYGEYAKIIGVQFEAFLKVQIKNNQKINVEFNDILDSIYAKVSETTKEDSYHYFEMNHIKLKTSFFNELEKIKVEDSLSKKEAISLCRSYASYLASKYLKNKGKKYARIQQEKKYIIEDNLFIKTRDGAELSTIIYRSKKDTIPKPVILKYTIYPDEYDYNDARMSVIYGYHGIVVSTRGKRNSPQNVISFVKDSEDLYDVIDWISKQKWCNGKIGMYGGSYLGFAQWAVNKNPHPALKTIVPMVSVGPGIDYPMYNNVFMSYMLRWINYVENNKFTDDNDFKKTKWDSLYVKWYKKGKAFNKLDSLDRRPKKTFQRWLSHPSYDEYWQNMMPYKEDFKKINIPILTFTGYYDSDQNGAMHYYKQHHKFNKDANHYLFIGPYDHYGAQIGPDLVLNGYKIDSVADVRFIPMSFKWFDYVLKDSIKPAYLKDKVNYQVMGTNKWKAKPRISDVSNDSLKLYLDNTISNNLYKLSLDKQKEKGFIKEEIDFLDRSEYISFQKTPDKILDTILNPKYSKVYVTDSFQEDFEINGSFKGLLDIEINKKDVDIFIELYELTEEGQYFALSTYLGRASYSKNRSVRKLLKPYKKESIPLKNSSFTSKLIKKGSKIVVVVGVNKNPYWQINYGTGKDVSEETINDGKVPLIIKWYNSSYISVPIYRL